MPGSKISTPAEGKGSHHIQLPNRWVSDGLSIAPTAPFAAITTIRRASCPVAFFAAPTAILPTPQVLLPAGRIAVSAARVTVGTGRIAVGVVAGSNGSSDFTSRKSVFRVPHYRTQRNKLDNSNKDYLMYSNWVSDKPKKEKFADVENIIDKQATREQRLSIADDVIVNNGSLDLLRNEVLKIHKKYLEIVKNG